MYETGSTIETRAKDHKGDSAAATHSAPNSPEGIGPGSSVSICHTFGSQGHTQMLLSPPTLGPLALD